MIMPTLAVVGCAFGGGWVASRLGVAGSGRLYTVSRGDDLDIESAQYYVNSSLSLVLLFRRRVKSVADVLKGIRRVHSVSVRCVVSVLGCGVSSWTLWACSDFGAFGSLDTSRSAWFPSVGDGCCGTAEWVCEAGRHCSS